MKFGRKDNSRVGYANRTFAIVLVLAMVFTGFLPITQALGDTPGAQSFIVYGDVQDNFGMSVDAGIITATDLDNDEYIIEYIQNGSYRIDLDAVNASYGDEILLSASNGMCISNITFTIENSETNIDFVLDPPRPSVPSIPPPNLDDLDFGFGYEPGQIPPPTPPEPPEGEIPPDFEEPEEAVVPEHPSPLISPEEEVFPPRPYLPGEKPRVVYNITLVDINSPTGALYVGKKAPLQFVLKNSGGAITKVDVDVSVIQPDGFEEYLGDLKYDIPPGMEKKRTLTWEPEQGGEHTILVEISYEENGVLIEYVEEVGFYVLHGTLDWGGGHVVSGMEIYPPDDYTGPDPYEIYLYEVNDQGDLIIEPGGTLIFRENQYGCRAVLIIDGYNWIDPANPFGIDIQKDATSEGVFEIHDGSTVRALSSFLSYTYEFDVHGTLTVDSGSTVKWMYGDASNPTNPAGVHLYDGSNTIISDGAKILEGYTHNIFVEGSSVTLTVTDSSIEEAGMGGLGHGIYVTNGASPAIENNNITDNGDCGIYIDTPVDKRIFNNTFMNNYEGIYLKASSPKIENNTFYGNDHGIVIDYDPTGTTFDIPVVAGWNLISVPLLQVDTDILSVLDDSAGDGATTWDYVQWYDASDPADHWKTYSIYKPPELNDLWDIDHKMGFWLNVVTEGDGELTVSGLLLPETTIDLYKDWTMVGYPTLDDSSYTVGNLKAETGATLVETDDGGAYNLVTLPDDYVLKRGEGYWVKVSTATTWTVNPGESSSPVITNNTISHCHRQAILGYWGSSPTILNNTMERNGYGIDLTGPTPGMLVKNNTVRYNTVGMWTYQGSPTFVENTVTFNENRGMWFQQSSPLIEENEISLNSVRTHFFDNVEPIATKWGADGLWHIVDDETSPYPNSYSPTHSWWYGQDTTGNYDTGTANRGTLYRDFDLTNVEDLTLTFQSWYETETSGPDKDQRWVSINYKPPGIAPIKFKLVQLYGEEMGKWVQHSVDLSWFAGDPKVKIAFQFNTVDEFNNDYLGWYIDDIQITHMNATVEGYGIFLQDSSNPTIRNNQISLNNIGIACYRNSNPTIIRNNITSSRYIGLYVNESAPVIESNNISLRTKIYYADPPGPEPTPPTTYNSPSNPLPYPTTIGFDSYTFDPIYGEPEIPMDLWVDTYPVGSIGNHIVQFEGAIQQTWLSEITALSAEIYDYIPNFAYIVGMDSTTADAVALLPYVRWTGIYQPAYRIDPRLPSIETNETNVTVLVMNNGNALTTINQIISMSNAVYSQWGFSFYKAIIVNVDLDCISAIAGLQDVYWIEPYIAPTLFDEVSSEIVGGFWAPGSPWNDEGSYVNSLGYDGTGVKVSVVDTGIDDGDIATMHPDLAGRVIIFIDYTEDDTTDGIGEDEYGHGTHCAGIIAGNGDSGRVDSNGYLYGMGVAPEAEFIDQRVFDYRGWWVAESDQEIVKDAVQNGAVIGSNSWGAPTGGYYTSLDAMYDYFVRDADPDITGNQEYTLVFSAGNSGAYPTSTGSPGNAKNVITVGASENYRPAVSQYASNPDEIAMFSSRGPPRDGRIKPDITAPGTWIASALSSSAEPGWAEGRFGGNIDDLYEYCSGTSMACPQVSGGAALFAQYYFDLVGVYPSPALTKAALINGAVDMLEVEGKPPFSFSTPSIPNNVEGWGRLDLVDVLDPSAKVFYEEQDPVKNLFTSSGETREYHVPVVDITVPFKVTLTWTDAPGSPSAEHALVNDLNLKVTTPDGKVYYGNQFKDGWSYQSQTVFFPIDYLNNVESVYINPAELIHGIYTVEISAGNIAGDGVPDIPGNDQDYALVVTNAGPRSKGIVQLDRTAYKSDDTAKVIVGDIDLVGYGSITITALSTIPSPVMDSETIILTETPPNSGVFEGTIDIEPAPGGIKDPNNGVLEVVAGDTIIVLYIDPLDGTTATDSAAVDDAPPVISNLEAIILPDKEVLVTWDTNEDSDSVVYFDTIRPPRWRKTNLWPTQEHSVLLSDLENGATYYFAVQSTDLAGNTALDDNGGKYYQFTILDYLPGLGVWITDYASPTLTNNDITENDRGIMVFASSSPIIENNRINKSVWSGIWSDDVDSFLTIKENNITENGWNGIQLSGASAKIEDNGIEINKVCGIYVYGSNSVIANNTICSNGYAWDYYMLAPGIYWRTFFGWYTPIITNNTIINNAIAGIYYYYYYEEFLKSYSISSVPSTRLYATDFFELGIYENNISSNYYYGVYAKAREPSGPVSIGDGETLLSGLSSQEPPIVRYNNISWNSYGIRCSCYAMEFHNNNITNNSQWGLSAYRTHPILENNTIDGNYGGLLSQAWGFTNSYLTAKNNTITNGTYGIMNGYRCFGEYYGNSITDNYIGFWDLWGGISTTTHSNISHNTYANVAITNSAGSIITNCNITDAPYGIVAFSARGSPYGGIFNNNITEHSLVGIYCDYSTGLYDEFRIEQNNISLNSEGIRSNNAGPLIIDNDIENNTYGIITTNSSVPIYNNTIHTNAVGIYCNGTYYNAYSDVGQEEHNELIYATISSTQSVAQSFIPAFNRTYQVNVYLVNNGANPGSTVTVHLRDSLDSEDIATSIPRTIGWDGLNGFTLHADLEPFKEYIFVVTTDATAGGYDVYGSALTEDFYENGTAYLIQNGDITEQDGDLAFLVRGKGSYGKIVNNSVRYNKYVVYSKGPGGYLYGRLEGWGIYLDNTAQTIWDNNISTNGYGVTIKGGSYSAINNTVLEHLYPYPWGTAPHPAIIKSIGYGFVVEEADFLHAVDNTFITNAYNFRLKDSEGIIDNATITSTHDPETEIVYTGIDFTNCSLEIINSNIFANTNGAGICVLKSGRDSLIYNTTMIGNNYGVSADQANITIDNCTILENINGGISCAGMSNVTITWSNISYNGGFGIECVESNGTISNNTISWNDDGISYRDSDEGIIRDNAIKHEDRYGIYLYSSEIEIISNKISYNLYGFYITQFNNNLIYHNNIIGNTIQAYDDGTNTWHNGYPSGGNYWSDYTGIDVKSGPNQDQPGSDGIGDTRYEIDVDSWDNYPLMEPWQQGKNLDFDTSTVWICDMNPNTILEILPLTRGHIESTGTKQNPILVYDNSREIEIVDFLKQLGKLPLENINIVETTAFTIPDSFINYVDAEIGVMPQRMPIADDLVQTLWQGRIDGPQNIVVSTQEPFMPYASLYAHRSYSAFVNTLSEATSLAALASVVEIVYYGDDLAMSQDLQNLATSQGKLFREFPTIEDSEISLTPVDILSGQQLFTRNAVTVIHADHSRSYANEFSLLYDGARPSVVSIDYSQPNLPWALQGFAGDRCAPTVDVNFDSRSYFSGLSGVLTGLRFTAEKYGIPPDLVDIDLCEANLGVLRTVNDVDFSVGTIQVNFAPVTLDPQGEYYIRVYYDDGWTDSDGQDDYWYSPEYAAQLGDGAFEFRSVRQWYAGSEYNSKHVAKSIELLTGGTFLWNKFDHDYWMLSPIYAALRQTMMVSVSGSMVAEIDTSLDLELDNAILPNNDYAEPDYLIVSSHWSTIPIQSAIGTSGFDGTMYSADGVYADRDNDGEYKPDISVGRIVGYDPATTVLLMNRGPLFDSGELIDSDFATYSYGSGVGMPPVDQEFDQDLRACYGEDRVNGWDCGRQTTQVVLWEARRSEMVVLVGHSDAENSGSTSDGVSSIEISSSGPYPPSLWVLEGCDTGIQTKKPNLVDSLLRCGAVNIASNVNGSGFSSPIALIPHLVDGKSIGEAYMIGRNQAAPMIFRTLYIIGDPMVHYGTELDTDDDGLSDFDEISKVGTDPCQWDWDGDLLPDGWEIHFSKTDPLVIDTDGDGVDDGYEADTDGDGLFDGEEWGIYHSNPLRVDTDNDGLTDPEEVYIYSTDPSDPDTDADGLNDGDEVITWNTDPHDPDSDDDGLLDGEEVNTPNLALSATATADQFPEFVDYVNDGHFYDWPDCWRAVLPAWLKFEFAQPEYIDRAIFYCTFATQHAPTGYFIEVSLDGNTWTPVNIVSTVIDPTNPSNYSISLYFDPVEAKYVRLTIETSLSGQIFIIEFEVFQASTDPLNPDTDGDNIFDGGEITSGTNPLDPTDTPPDTDVDGMDDNWETLYFGDLSQNSNDDYDGDSWSNLMEYLYNTDPQDPGSHP